jgi:hypothetical protein
LRTQTTYLAASRVILLTVSAAYAALLVYAMDSYASVEWAQYGHSFGQITLFEWLLIAVAISVWSAVLPVSMRGPSDVILVVLYLGVCIPGIVVPLGLERKVAHAYYPIVIAITVGFALACVAVRSLRPGATPAVRRCSPYFVHGLLGAWIACLAILIGTYASVMTLVSLDAIYDQREAGAATSRFIGYVQTYFGYVLSPALLAFGLARRQFALIAVGLAGGILLYSVTAEKNAFAFPFLVVAFSFALTRRSELFRSSAFVLVFIAGILALSVPFYDSNLVAAFFAWYVGVRSLLTPGLFVAQYHDFFSDWGYTHLSHVTGFGTLVPPPAAPGANDRWPSLGHLVGEQYVGIPTLNANASFVASDGIASFGAVGVLMAFVLLAIFLIALERSAAGIPRRFCMLIALPIGLTLTNVSLFTVFLSFGGFFWLLMFGFCFRRDVSVQSQSPPPFVVEGIADR